jgi:DNA repair protein RecO (recombination protein O)
MATSGNDQGRQDQQPAFVLHTYPFRETSLVVETYTRTAGRVAVVARGARRPKSALRGLLLAFQPLLLSWSGKSELHTLIRAEWQGGYLPLRGSALMCGFYLNELLLKLLARHDAHEALYDVYSATLQALAAGGDHARILRSFEMKLLSELGYALTLDQDVNTGHAVAAEETYTYVIERGPVALPADRTAIGLELAGQTLLDMQRDDYTSPITQQQSKALMRMLINHLLGDQVLHTRQLLRDLQQL